ncbi:MAG: motility associated factor glycosyltransferase family protein [Deltaproteobacteria bacterium]|nr:motility associated factor glycosyltransferase family protein [Deltaproteobacteria bacterium]
MASALEKNLIRLAEQDRDLAEQVQAAPVSRHAEVFAARSGEMTAVVDGISLHSRFDPIAEAEKWANAAWAMVKNAGDKEPVVFGFGLGYHVLALVQNMDLLRVIEPRLDILKLAFSYTDFSPVLSRLTYETRIPAVPDRPPGILLTHTPSRSLNRTQFDLWSAFVNGRETIGDLLDAWKFLPGMSDILACINKDKPGELSELVSIIENRKEEMSEGETLLMLLNEFSAHQ